MEKLRKIQRGEGPSEGGCLRQHREEMLRLHKSRRYGGKGSATIQRGKAEAIQTKKVPGGGNGDDTEGGSRRRGEEGRGEEKG